MAEVKVTLGGDNHFPSRGATLCPMGLPLSDALTSLLLKEFCQSELVHIFSFLELWPQALKFFLRQQLLPIFNFVNVVKEPERKKKIPHCRRSQ